MTWRMNSKQGLRMIDKRKRVNFAILKQVTSYLEEQSPEALPTRKFTIFSESFILSPQFTFGLKLSDAKVDSVQRLKCGCATCLLIQMLIKIQSNFNLKFSRFLGLYMFYSMERNKKKQEWTAQEIQLLTALYPQYNSKKWKRISEEFREKGYQRSEIDCREKWINFLDPSVKKNQWEESQLRRLYDLHQQVGTRWCLIQKQINRTQNKIKNRFYGTIRNFIRFVLSYFDSTRTCYNWEISKLSPKFLNDLYGSQNTFSFMNGETKEAVYEMKFIVDKKIMAERIREHRPLYSRMHQIIFQAFENINSSPVPEPDIEAASSQEAVPDALPENNTQVKREESTSGVPLEYPLPYGSDMQFGAPQFYHVLPCMQFQPTPPGVFYWFS